MASNSENSIAVKVRFVMIFFLVYTLIGFITNWTFIEAAKNLTTILTFHFYHFELHVISLKIIFLLLHWLVLGKYFVYITRIVISNLAIQITIGAILSTLLLYGLSSFLGITVGFMVVLICSSVGGLYLLITRRYLWTIKIKSKSNAFKPALKYLIAYLVITPVSLKSELAFDATLYHVSSALNFIKFDHFVNLYHLTNLFQYGVPNFNSLLQVQAILVGGTQAATLLSTFQFLGIIFLTTSISNTIFKNRSSSWIGLSLLSIPIFAWTSVHAYSDIFAAFYLLVIVSIFLNQVVIGNLNNLVLFGFFVGFSFSIKFSAFLYAILLTILLMQFVLKNKDSRKRNLGRLGLGFTLGFSPVLLWSFFTSGNPFFPYLTKFIPTYGYTPVSNRLQDDYFNGNPGNLSVLDVVLFPFHITYFQKFNEGFLGVVGLFTIVFSLYCAFLSNSGILRRLVTINFIWIVTMLLVIPANFRYFTAIFPILLLCLATFFEQIAASLSLNTFIRNLIIIVISSTSIIFSPFFVNITYPKNFTPGIIGPLEYDYAFSRKEYQIKVLLQNSFPAMDLVNSRLSKSDIVLDLAGLERISMYVQPLIFDASQWTSPLMNGELRYTDQNLALALKTRGINFILVDSAHMQLIQDNAISNSLSLIGKVKECSLFRIV